MSGRAFLELFRRSNSAYPALRDAQVVGHVVRVARSGFVDVDVGFRRCGLPSGCRCLLHHKQPHKDGAVHEWEHQGGGAGQRHHLTVQEAVLNHRAGVHCSRSALQRPGLLLRDASRQAGRKDGSDMWGRNTHETSTH